MQNILFKLSEKHWAIIIFIFAFAIYSNTIFNDYNLDDNLVTQNHRLTSQGISAIPEIFKSYYYEDDMGYKYGYRPVTHTSFAIEHSLFGEKASISHAVNVFLYAITCLLISLFVRKLKPDISIYFAVLVALLFAVHPIHTEVVASIKNRDEILSLLFGLLALLTTLSIGKKEAFHKEIFKWLIILSLFYLSLLSKKSTVFFTVLIPSLYILYNNEIYLPLLFNILSSIIVSFVLNIALYESLIYITLSLCLVILLYLRFNKSFIDVKKKIEIYLFSKHSYTFLIAVLLFAFILGFIFSNGILVYLSIIFLFIMWGVFKKIRLRLITSTLLLFLFYFLASKIDRQNFLIVSFWVYLIINAELISNHKLKFIIVLISSILSSFWINSFQGFTGVEIFLVLLYFSSIYFKPIFIVFPIIALFKANGEIINILIASISILVVIDFSIKKISFKSLNIRFILVPLILLLSLFSEFNDFSFTGNITKNNITQTSDIVTNVDRPILKIENPLIENWNFQHRIPTAFTTTKFYLQKLMLPFPLLFYYGYDKVQIADYKSLDFYIALVIVLLLLAIAFYNFKKRKLLSFGIFFMLINLIPYSNLMIPVAGIVGERLAYASSFGFVLFSAALLFDLNEKYKLKKVLFVIVILFFSLSSAFTVYRNSLWKDKLTLFQNDIKHLEKSAQANGLLAYVYLNDNDLVEGLQYLNKAIAVYPNFLNWWFDKAKLEDQLGQIDNAIISYERAINLDSTFSKESLLKLSFLNASKQNFERAIFYLEKEIRLYSNTPELFNTLASYYMNVNNTELSIQTLEKGLISYPGNYDLNLNLGKVYYGLENNFALIYFEKAFSIDSSDKQLSRAINELKTQ